MSFPHPHLLGIEGLTAHDVHLILDSAERWIAFNRQPRRQEKLLAGLTQLNCFFENSTRTSLSFEVAGKRLGAQVATMAVAHSSVAKGESLIDTFQTLNAMRPDVIVIRHPETGAARQVSEIVDCPVINAGDGDHEHPTQALLDAMTIKGRLGRIADVRVAICGDVRHSRVARSNMRLLPLLGAHVRVVGPAALLPDLDLLGGIDAFDELERGIAGVDVVMMLRVQRERIQPELLKRVDPDLFGGGGDYHALYGLTRERLDRLAPNALVMHPGPINRGVEIEGALADDRSRSAILDQVENGVAVRMACLDLLTRARRGD